MDADIVPGDDILGRNIERVSLEADLADGVDGPEDQDEARPLGLTQDASEAEDDTALILIEDFDAAKEIQDNQTDEKQQWIGHGKP
jgi:hypothetical protein